MPIPRFLVDNLAAHVASKSRDELVFPGAKGGALRTQVFQRAAFDSAVEAIGVAGMHPHELRRAAASLAIASGTDVRVVQQMLGHKSATMTLDLYGHLFPDPVGCGRRRARRRSSRSSCCPSVAPSSCPRVGNETLKRLNPQNSGVHAVAPTGFEPALPP